MPIHWDKFSEIEVQGILYQHFISLDYKVDWIRMRLSLQKERGDHWCCGQENWQSGVWKSRKGIQRNYEKTRRSMDTATNYGRFSNRRFSQTTL